MPDVKVCGMTRGEDAHEAARLGAAYVGVVFAGGPRTLDAETARDILRGLPAGVRTVGVFGRTEPGSIASTAAAAGVDIVQLHGDPDPATIREVRRVTGRPVWAALRVSGTDLPNGADDVFTEADAVVLDARAEHALGGTGITLPWAGLSERITTRPGRAKLVLAGGLTPLNVSEAVAALSPDVVDVSSGVESAPGIKDHHLMRAFLAAARFNRGPA